MPFPQPFPSATMVCETMNERATPPPPIDVRGLSVSYGERQALVDVSLTVPAGTIVGLLGPNGSGKSTLANTLVGKPEYTVTAGEILYEGMNLLKMEPELRAREGIFLAFQYPLELPGVRSWQFLKSALDSIRGPPAPATVPLAGRGKVPGVLSDKRFVGPD